MTEMYYIQDTRQFVGNDVLWWGPDRKGYTCKIDQAGLYTKEEAIAQFKSRETDVPWPQEYIDGVTSRVVDHQAMKRETCGEELPHVERWQPPKPKPQNCDGCGRFLTTEQMYCGCDNCGTAP